jgi:hypothetical protein
MQNISIKNEGSWIFLSHSSKDIEKIRLIRNEFEKWGQNPLAFHLKCLNTDTRENESFLFDLIKKEIEARNWFVYCESESAQNSKYVQLEREYVEKVGKVQIWKLDLSKPIEEIILKIKTICTQLQVFISYSIKDYDDFVLNLIDELKNNDFSIWDNNIISNDLQFKKTDNAIASIFKEGFFLGILTENSLELESFWLELEVAKQNKAKIIILIFGNVISSGDERFRGMYSSRGLYTIPCIPKKEDMHLLSDIVLGGLQRLRGGSIDMQANVRNIENDLQEKLNYEHRFHPEKPVWVSSTGAMDDYCEYYKFPCCGKGVLMGDGVPSQYRFDGCKKYENK